MNNRRGGIMDFDEFVQRQQLESGEAEADWKAERDSWLNYLEGLYRQIQSFLSAYTSDKVKVSYLDIILNEENLGSYTARRMLIKIGRQEITMTPVGTLIIGAKGRVDVEGPAGRFRLVLVDRDAQGPRIKVAVTVGKTDPPKAEISPKEIEWAWKIATNPPTIRYVELTQEAFFDALLEIVNA